MNNQHLLAQDLSNIANQGGLGNVNFDLGTLISRVLPYVYGAAGIALLIYLVLGGFQLMLAKGDPKAIQAAQGKITNALIGFIIIVIAYSLTVLLGQLFKLGSFGQIFGGGSGPIRGGL